MTATMMPTRNGMILKPPFSLLAQFVAQPRADE